MWGDGSWKYVSFRSIEVNHIWVRLNVKHLQSATCGREAALGLLFNRLRSRMGLKLPSFFRTRKYFEWNPLGWTLGVHWFYCTLLQQLLDLFWKGQDLMWIPDNCQDEPGCYTGGLWRNWRQYPFSRVTRSHLLSVMLLQWCNLIAENCPVTDPEPLAMLGNISNIFRGAPMRRCRESWWPEPRTGHLSSRRQSESRILLLRPVRLPLSMLMQGWLTSR